MVRSVISPPKAPPRPAVPITRHPTAYYVVEPMSEDDVCFHSYVQQSTLEFAIQWAERLIKEGKSVFAVIGVTEYGQRVEWRGNVGLTGVPLEGEPGGIHFRDEMRVQDPTWGTW